MMGYCAACDSFVCCDAQDYDHPHSSSGFGGDYDRACGCMPAAEPPAPGKGGAGRFCRCRCAEPPFAPGAVKADGYSCEGQWWGDLGEAKPAAGAPRWPRERDGIELRWAGDPAWYRCVVLPGCLFVACEADGETYGFAAAGEGADEWRWPPRAASQTGPAPPAGLLPLLVLLLLLPCSALPAAAFVGPLPPAFPRELLPPLLARHGLALSPDPRAPLRYAYSPATGCLARAAGGGGGEPAHISVQPAVENVLRDGGWSFLDEDGSGPPGS
jgi:hypothetical protein